MYSRLRNGFQKPDPDAKEKTINRARRIVSDIVRRRYCAHLATRVDCTFKRNNARDQKNSARRNVVILRMVSENLAIESCCVFA